MTKRIQQLSSLIVFMLIGAFILPVAHAGFGPGYTSGWDVATDGLKGFMHGYNAPSSAYAPGSTLTVRAHIDNPSDNTITVTNRPIYVMINRVVESPVGTSLTNAHNSISEGTLFNNNLAGDTQTLVSSHFVQTISLAPGQSTEVSYTFTPTQKGYYQIDFADQDFASGFNPGHILAAGFIRVYEEPGNGSGEDDDNNNESNNSTSNNRGSNNRSAFAGLLGTGGQVLGTSTVSSETSPSTGTPTTTNSGDVLGSESTAACAVAGTNWLRILVLEAIALAIVLVIAKALRLSTNTTRILVAVVTIIAVLIAYIKPCTCADSWICNYKVLLTLAEGVVALILGKFTNKVVK